jgi:hypothetical protein
MEPKLFYHDFYPQNTISYKLNLPEPDQEKIENTTNQNQNQSNQNQPNQNNQNSLGENEQESNA